MRRDYKTGYKYLYNVILQGIKIVREYEEDGVFQYQLEDIAGFFECYLGHAERIILEVAGKPAWHLDGSRAGIHRFPLEVLPLEDLLFRLRKENKISLKRAAEELGISAYRYQQYETKGSKPVPDLEERKKLAKLFGAQVELLIKAERLPLKRPANRKRGPDNITKI